MLLFDVYIPFNFTCSLGLASLFVSLLFSLSNKVCIRLYSKKLLQWLWYQPICVAPHILSDPLIHWALSFISHQQSNEDEKKNILYFSSSVEHTCQTVVVIQSHIDFMFSWYFWSKESTTHSVYVFSVFSYHNWRFEMFVEFQNETPKCFRIWLLFRRWCHLLRTRTRTWSVVKWNYYLFVGQTIQQYEKIDEELQTPYDWETL